VQIPFAMRSTLAAVASAVLAACTAVPAPTNVTTWRDPLFAGPPFTKIFVVGLSSQSLVDQGGFENVMVTALRNAGVDAMPGWQFVPTDRVPDQETMRSAIVRSGADAALLVRMSVPQTETALAYSPGTVEQAGPGLYVGWYEPGVTTESYQAATVYTTLFDVATARPVWTYNPPTYGPMSLQQDVPAFAADVIARLQAAGLLAPR
jgi:hypothetical protein